MKTVNEQIQVSQLQQPGFDTPMGPAIAVRGLVERCAEGEDELPREEWTAEAKEDVERMQQYKERAERAFYRSLNALEILKIRMVRDAGKVFEVRAASR